MKKHSTIKPAPSTCPCGGFNGSAAYAQCCQPYIDGTRHAPTAEQLMRSRYTAYTLGEAAYILSTWHESTRPRQLDLEPPGAPHGVRWLGLTVHNHSQPSENQSQVEFTARYREAGRAHRLKEKSRFVRENQQWFYVDGEIEPDPGS
jgi:SEC-C motif-containing protein